MVFFITLIAAASSFPLHVAELLRAADQAPFSTGTFLASCGLVAEAVDFLACHLGCLAPAPLTALAQGVSAREGPFEEPADRLRKRWLIILAACPCTDFGFEIRRQPNHDQN